MWSGDHYGTTRPHGMLVGGNPAEQIGNPGETHNTYHSPENLSLLHGPPSNDVWLLTPAEMAWFGKSSQHICEQIKDPDRNGGCTVEEVADHITHDPLVLWGWKPGPVREPAPGTPEDAATALLEWMVNGTPCPQ